MVQCRERIINRNAYVSTTLNADDGTSAHGEFIVISSLDELGDDFSVTAKVFR